MRALYFFFGSICIAGGVLHCFAILKSPLGFFSRIPKSPDFGAKSTDFALHVLFQQQFDPGHDHIQRGHFVTAFGDDDIRVTFGRLHEFEMHWSDGGLILFDD